jgi:hypothetical protein
MVLKSIHTPQFLSHLYILFQKNMNKVITFKKCFF